VAPEYHELHLISSERKETGHKSCCKNAANQIFSNREPTDEKIKKDKGPVAHLVNTYNISSFLCLNVDL